MGNPVGIVSPTPEMVHLAHDLQNMPAEHAMGICAAFLLSMADTKPEQLRRVLSERVIKSGLVGESLITCLNRACR